MTSSDNPPPKGALIPSIRKIIVYNPHRKGYHISSRHSGSVQHVLSSMPPALRIKLYTF
jgi:hypothetical protein